MRLRWLILQSGAGHLYLYRIAALRVGFRDDPQQCNNEVRGTHVAVQELLESLGSPLQRRKDEWLGGLADQISKLEAEHQEFDVRALADDPVFVSTLLRASQQAMTSHQREKRDALRNAVINSALPNRPDENLQQIFLAYIDDLTVWHIEALQHLQAPGERGTPSYRDSYASLENESIRDKLQKIQSIASVYPKPEGFGWEDVEALELQILLDLHNRGLMEVAEETSGESRTIWSQRSHLGQVFFDFIREPGLESPENTK